MPLFADAIRLGQTADLEGAFYAAPLALGRVDCEGLEFKPIIGDRAELDRQAADEQLDLAPISPAAWAGVSEKYALLPFGARMRRRGGPMVVAGMPVTPQGLAGKTLAVAGELLSETLAAQMLLAEIKIETAPEHEIARRVLNGQCDAGILAAEPWAERSAGADHRALHPIMDLAAAWTEHSGGHPLPLTLLAIRKGLSPELARRAARVLRRSNEYAERHREEALAFAAGLRPGMKIETARRLIEEPRDAANPPDEEALRTAVEALFDRTERVGYAPPGIANAFEEI